MSSRAGVVGMVSVCLVSASVGDSHSHMAVDRWVWRGGVLLPGAAGPFTNLVALAHASRPTGT